MTWRASVSAVVVAALLASCMGSRTAQPPARPGRGDQGPVSGVPTPEEDIKELRVAPPAYPRDSDLAEIKLLNPTPNRFFVDTSSLTVGKDRIVRFVLVIRTPTNETNVRFSGMHCEEREWKDYAIVGADRSWKVDEAAQWRRIQELRYNNFQYTLYDEFFCSGGVLSSHPAGDAAKLVKLLRHPPKKDPRIPNRNE
jgi:CNP1-like family